MKGRFFSKNEIRPYFNKRINDEYSEYYAGKSSFVILMTKLANRVSLYGRSQGPGIMDKDKLRDYLNTRRQGWPYEESYHVDRMGGPRFVAKIGDELAGLSYAEIIETGREARMKMNLKGSFAEYGIGTELLNLLMDDLITSGYEIIRYEIPPERYAYQIYRNMGFTVDSQDEEAVRFIWRKNRIGGVL